MPQFRRTLFLITVLWAAGGQVAAQDPAIRLGDWSSPEAPAEGVFYLSNGPGREGGESLVIDVPAGAAPRFYQYSQDLRVPSDNAVYEISAWVKTEAVADGVGAFVAVGVLEPEPPHARFASGDSARLTQTRDWTYLRGAVYAPPGVDTLRLLLMLNGTGAAYFDDVELRRVTQYASLSAQSEARIVITDRVTTHDFIGFGVEDDCFFYTEENLRHVGAEDIALRNRRIAELEPSVIATLFWWDAISPARDLDEITYDTELMRALVRTLRVHQEAGRRVFFGDVHWGWSPERFVYSDENVERGVQAYAEMLRYLIQDQGLSCIRYVAISGEVDMVFEALGGSEASYLKACRLLQQRLSEFGLDQVKVIGDKSGGFAWFAGILPRLDPYVGVFTVHEYPDGSQYPIIDWRLDTALEVIREGSKPVGMRAGRPVYKPAFVYEIGAVDQDNPNPRTLGVLMPSYRYGLICANSSISAMNRGYMGGSVWCLHSMYYPGENLMDFGLWEFKHADWRIRPVYYGYGLISRFAPPGARPLLTEVEPDFAQVSAATVETPAGRTLFAVNLSENAVTCEIDGLEGGPYAVYEYAEERLPEPGEPGYGELETLRTGDAWSPGEALTLRPETLTALRELP